MSNKIKELVKQLPPRYSYANKVVERLKERGIVVSQVVVYQTVGGYNQNQDVLNEILILVEEYKHSQKSFEERMKNVVETL